MWFKKHCEGPPVISFYFAKPLLWNYFFMVGSLFLLTLAGSSIGPVFLHLPFLLWVPFMIYWILYRKTTETLIMLYFITWVVSSTSTVPTSHLLLLNSGFFLILTLFKNVYYTHKMFFGLACAVMFLLMPFTLGLLCKATGMKAYLPSLTVWVPGSVLNWFLIWPLFYLLRFADRFCEEMKKNMDPRGMG